ncbi:hypothetical protein GCM10020295_81750 [Streptomyces cinereospinus]
MVAGLDQGVDEGPGCSGDQDGAGYVEGAGGRAGQAGQDPGEREEDDQADGDVHEEDPGPAWACCDQPAQQHAERGTPAAERRPDTQRAVAFVAVEEPHHHGQRGGREQRGARPLGDACGEQQRGAGGESGSQGRCGEHGEPGQDDLLRAEQVCGPAAEQHETSEREGVSADHPGQCRAVQVQLGTHVGQCDRDDGDVEDQHQLGQPQQAQDRPAQRMRCIRCACPGGGFRVAHDDHTSSLSRTELFTLYVREA